MPTIGFKFLTGAERMLYSAGALIDRLKLVLPDYTRVHALKRCCDELGEKIVEQVEVFGDHWQVVCRCGGSVPLKVCIAKPPSSDVLVLRQIFVEEEYRPSVDIFSPERAPSVIVDIGANIGLSALYFGAHYPQSHILAIEPDTRNFSCLEKNIGLNPGRGQITALRCALHDSVTQVAMSPSFRDGRDWSHTVTDKPDADAALVDARTLPAICAERGIGKIDLLKMDIEGHEFVVFKHPETREFVRRNVEVLCMELHEERGNCIELAMEIAALGFRVEQHRSTFIFVRNAKTS